MQAAKLATKPQGILRIACPPSFADHVLSNILTIFLQKYPELEIELLASNTTYDLNAERIDVAIRYGHLLDSTLIATRLCPLEEVICASPKYLKKYGTPTTPEELKKHSCLVFLLRNYSLSWRFRNASQPEHSVSLYPRFRSSSAQTLKECTIKGMGITILPKISLKEELNKSLLIPLLTDYEATSTRFGSSIWLVYPSKEYLPFRVRVFIDQLNSYFAAIQREK